MSWKNSFTNFVLKKRHWTWNLVFSSPFWIFHHGNCRFLDLNTHRPCMLIYRFVQFVWLRPVELWMPVDSSRHFHVCGCSHLLVNNGRLLANLQPFFLNALLLFVQEEMFSISSINKNRKQYHSWYFHLNNSSYCGGTLWGWWHALTWSRLFYSVCQIPSPGFNIRTDGHTEREREKRTFVHGNLHEPINWNNIYIDYFAWSTTANVKGPTCLPGWKFGLLSSSDFKLIFLNFPLPPFFSCSPSPSLSLWYDWSAFWALGGYKMTQRWVETQTACSLIPRSTTTRRTQLYSSSRSGPLNIHHV